MIWTFIKKYSKTKNVVITVNGKTITTNAYTLTLNMEDIKVIGTKLLETLRAEQQKSFELNSLKLKFDDAVNILYMNDLSNLAATCTNLRPESLDVEDVENANFVIEAINSNLSDDYVIENKHKIKSLISNRNSYNYYKENSADNPIFLKAKKYAKN